MDEYKFKPLEDWLKEIRQGDCDSYIAMAVNKDHKLCATVRTDLDGFVEMLMTASRKNQQIATAVTMVAAFLTQKAKGGMK